jgi:hypothetical protein
MVLPSGDNRVGSKKRICAKYFPRKIPLYEKDNRHAGAGLKMGLLYPDPVVMMKKAGAPCPFRLIFSNCFPRSFDHADLSGDQGQLPVH